MKEAHAQGKHDPMVSACFIRHQKAPLGTLGWFPSKTSQCFRREGKEIWDSWHDEKVAQKDDDCDWWMINILGPGTPSLSEHEFLNRYEQDYLEGTNDAWLPRELDFAGN